MRKGSRRRSISNQIPGQGEDPSPFSSRIAVRSGRLGWHLAGTAYTNFFDATDYAAVSPGDRRRLLAQFARFVRELPFSFFVLRYGVSDARNREELEARIRRDLALFVFDRLPYFQLFDVIAVYYDNGQGAVSIALRDALDFVLAKNVADYRDADPSARRLLQVADYICTVVRVSDDYDAGRQTKTHERFFGNRRSFMQSFKKQLDRKLLN